jgi:hypothetical protein
MGIPDKDRRDLRPVTRQAPNRGEHMRQPRTVRAMSRPRFVRRNLVAVTAAATALLAACGGSTGRVEASAGGASDTTSPVTAPTTTAPTQPQVSQWFVAPAAASTPTTAAAAAASKTAAAASPASANPPAPTVNAPGSDAPSSLPASTATQSLSTAFLGRLPSGYALESSNDLQMPDGTVVRSARFRAADGIGVVSVRWQQLAAPWPILPDPTTPNQSSLGSYTKSADGETLVINHNAPDLQVMFVAPTGSLVNAYFTVDPSAYRTAFPDAPTKNYQGMSLDTLEALARASTE